MLTKPCTRPGCTGLITEAGTGRYFDRRRFCSVRCAAIARYQATGWMPATTHAQRVAGGRKAGLLAGERRRKVAAQKAAEAIAPWLTEDILGRLEHAQQVKLKALLVRVWHVGHTAGRSAAREQQKVRRVRPQGKAA